MPKPISLEAQTKAYNRFYDTAPVEEKGVSPATSDKQFAVTKTVKTNALPTPPASPVPPGIQAELDRMAQDKGYNQFYATQPVEEKGVSPKKKGGAIKGRDWHGFGRGGKTGKTNHGF